LITVLVDHDVEGQAALLLSALVSGGWIELGVLRMATFAELSVPLETSDQRIWEFAQEQRMLLLTGNRNKDGEESLEQTILAQNQPSSLPVITIANLRRVSEKDYRERCAAKLAEMCWEVERYLGTGRLYIP
jgi:hypothetical protein